VWGAIAGSGAAAGTLLGGVLTSGLGWSWIFFVNVPVGIGVVLLSPWLLRESRVEGHLGSDFAGAFTVTAGLMLLVYAMTEAATKGWGTGRTIVLLIASVVLLAAFVVIELRSSAPIMPFRIFRLRNLRTANIIFLLLGASLFSQFFLMTLYMQNVLGYSPLKTGVAYVATTVTSIVFAGIGQALVTKFGVKPVLTVGLAMAAVTVAVFYTRLPVDGTYTGNLLVPFLITGAGLGLSFVPGSIAALTSVKPQDAGLASGLLNTSPQIGGAIGLALAATLATTFTTRFFTSHPGASLPQALVSGYHVAFVLLAALAILGAVVAALFIEGGVAQPAAQAEPQLEPARAD